MQPILRESSRISNELAGREGETYRKRDPEGYAAQQRRHGELGVQMRAYEMERVALLESQGHYEPLDPTPYLREAQERLEGQKSRLAWAARQAFTSRSEV